MAAAADWSSLPFDLVRRVAGCLLADNDVDYYMDLRAVCGSWRSATDDPKDSPDDPRFRPRHWVVLDDADVFQSERTRLLVNTRTGRFLRKELPLLVGHRYSYVATAPGGLFVLADCDDYDAARVFNPFTGHMIHFMATVPSDMVDAAAVIGSSPTLVLLCGGSDCKRYMAEPDSRSFALYQEEDAYPLIRLAVAGGMYADGKQRPVPPLPAAVADKIFDLMRVFSVDPSQMFWSDVIEHVVDDAPEIGHANNNRCYLVQFLGEVFIVFKLQHRMEVFRMDDSDRGVLEPVKNIGRRAIFVGCCRCLAVDADKFPSVEANCIYHLVGMNPYGDFYFHDVYKYDLEDGTEEMVSEAINWSDPITRRDADPPFTAVQLLSSYTINVRCSELVIREVCRVDVDQLVEEFFST